MFDSKVMEELYSEILLAEKDNKAPEWIQVLRTGSFSYSFMEERLIIDSNVLREMKNNYDNNIRGCDLMIDFAHNSHLEAAGWIKAIELRENDNQLWCKIDWTPKGKQAVENKEYRYLSADFALGYKDAETDKEYGVVLFGAGLTNRPFVKKMAPTTELMEVSLMEAKLKELETLNVELTDANKKLNEQVEKLASELKVANEKLAEVQAQKEKDAKETEFNKLLSEGKVVPAQKEAFLKGDMAEFIKNTQKVNLTEQGNSQEGTSETVTETEDQKIEKISAEAKKLAEEKKISLFDAFRLVMKPKSKEE